MFKVLIVDDTKSVHAFVKNLLLKSKEVEVTSVHNGAEAVELLKENDQFDLILLDWEMPVLNGPETFLAIKGMGLRIPTIMMTTKNDPEDIQKMFSAGIDEYLMKPFTIDILFQKMEWVSGKAFSYAA
ncbi:MAG: response regulator [Bdellovibrionales bacterium]|nr:response regulator [Bdellovibrionales bacterium]